MSARPPLPTHYANPHLPITTQSTNLPLVKYQILNCQGQDILVGRLKIATPTVCHGPFHPSGHAFILRRFDTGAVSVTTMFRAAFPNTSEHEERVETQWIKDTFDLSGNNGSIRDQAIARLAGTWVSPALAVQLGHEYGLGPLINTIVAAQPDPSASYRRSGRSAANPNGQASPVQNGTAPISSPVASRPLQTSTPAAAVPPAAKRRKESSPVPNAAPPSQAPAPPRRAVRTKSPAPRSAPNVAPLSSVLVTRTPRVPKMPAAITRKEEELALTPGGSEETIIDHVAGDELREQDILEQRELIDKLKAEREAARAEKEAAARKAIEEEEESNEAGESGEEEEQGGAVAKGKRPRDEEEEAPLRFNFREPDQENAERPIATNNRVAKWQLNPGTKRMAWGVAAFAAGLGAALLPSFF
ncbi:hypothetical protein AMATHDRAFT_73780 [Amanita thiersii Skay4041]|uniref:HTH APSES-type domain-containing protein n=1 Tax=Amanita thiersii Skay4041 TaxID=703135 RepID=A0A2A9NPP3_9AGAR|nr:hypothetical protein AMATHDRAFT_73780 [Amanita thiersii Skay4041]